MNADFSQNTALLLIDLQKGFQNIEYWGGGRNNRNAEKKAAQILNVWREHRLPLIHVQHCSTTPESPLAPNHLGNEFIEATKPIEGEAVIQKKVNSAFIGTGLKERLARMQIKKLVIVGMTTDHCISTTTRMAGNYGFETYLIEDATATFDKIGVKGEKFSAQLIHDTALASLQGEFASIVSAKSILDFFVNND